MDADQITISVLMFPWLGHGHVSPFLELGKKLSTRNFKIYLCSTPINLNGIKPKLTQKYTHSIELVELHIPALPDLPPQYHTSKNLHPNLIPILKQALDLSKPIFSQILKTLKSDLLIYDFLPPWAPVIASSYNIPAVEFITSSVIMATFVHNLFPFQDSIYLREYDKLGVSFGKEETQDIVLIKTFKEILPIPLVQDGISEDDDGGIIDWLKKKEKGSTVFVSFGTEYFLSKHEMEEIALGLELSGVNFIWVLRFPMGSNTSVERALPLGFLERVGERGLVVEGWAPQVKILRHPSVGGFVSHCGWGSTMEAMKYGTPIIAIPMQYDQPLNARLVEEIGVGVEVVRDSNGKFDRVKLGDLIKNVVLFDGEGTVRKKARELGETLSMVGEEDIDVLEELLKLYVKKKGQMDVVVEELAKLYVK
ncbi:Beta-D-glucosyl crocetin beta-1,6-glucosyltransferase [Actinidia chinensis var. chinensis]|uniref:Glycosyltransferase n=1 Tax=Actinidia chinensis var. chinensis TaxID=1590841 RepID=A0A2R6QPR9_ACTCC|nr:Beta-D-glucosyl crocetin beta-1,6-glucosyltransferase [Actinidia chinensis var. chinensis]